MIVGMPQGFVLGQIGRASPIVPQGALTCKRSGQVMKKPRRYWSGKRGQGEGITFLRDHVDYDGEGCLIWPLSRNPNGYGQLGFEGKSYWAHRMMCELVNGPPPTPDHDAAHSCGRGHDACIHPKHLSWKTRSENLLDCRVHGTQARQFHGAKGRLTDAHVNQIRSLRGKETQAKIAERFGVSTSTIRDIYLGRSHRPNPKKRAYTDEEDAFLRSNASRGVGMIADHLGRSEGSVRARLYRIVPQTLEYR